MFVVSCLLLIVDRLSSDIPSDGMRARRQWKRTRRERDGKILQCAVTAGFSVIMGMGGELILISKS
jgi:hypothetical protein